MKTTTRLFRTISVCSAGVLSLAAFASAAPDEKSETRTEVMYLEPERFTDVRDTNNDTDRNRDYILRDLKTFLQERAEKLLPPGAKLSVRITDIDMAGDFEPWRGPARGDVRIVKESYPPRIKLSFRLTDAGGDVHKQGERELTNPNFMRTLSPTFPSDPYRYEKTLIDDWLRTELPAREKSS